ncbi:BamA/TamA family outer membrane protein [Gaopeijia maritima]|uniref:BamA/TamA family outer membrane protein n=1 Tax=Gaopeijia maritima TaxID=3119007 RepID=UPI003253B74F
MRLTLVALCLTLLLPGLAGAQERCPDGRVTRVFVDNRSIFDLDELEGAPFQWAYHLANRLHYRTRPSFIRREILLAPGDCWDPFLAEDSGRLLRRLGFIARSDVYGVRQPDGDWHVVVDTQDEWTTVVEVGGRLDGGLKIDKVRLREENFLGRGFVAGFLYREDDAQRRLGGELGTPRLFNSRVDAGVRAGETRVGPFVEEQLFYPFVGEVGRFAARQRFIREEDYFTWSLGTPDAPRHLLLPVDREAWEVTLAARIGEPGNLTVFGVGISRDRLEFASLDAAEQVFDNRFGDPEPAPADLADQLAPQTAYRAGTRVNLLLGQRNIRFEQRQGLDALRGVHDVELGTEFALTLGRSLGFAASRREPDDLYVRTRLYAAGAPDPFVFIGNASIEARQIFSGATASDGWRDVLAEFDFLAYWQPPVAARHTFFARVAAAGGWNTDLPFQLTLGGAAGVRGYHDEDFPGSRRVVVSVEDRIDFRWPFPEVIDLGGTLFADAGRVWDDDLGLGSDSGWRGTLGAGLRIGFPSGSRTVVRIDVGAPFGGVDGRDAAILRVSFQDLLGVTAGLDDRQMDRSRRLRVGPDIFSPVRMIR